MTAEPTREELLEIIRALREENALLKKRIEELERQQRKYVAPHSRGQRKADPKKAGRKAGEGSFTYRQIPKPEEIDGPAIDVPVPNTCTACGYQGELQLLKTDLAWITELPEAKRFTITEYRVPVMLCPQCGQRVRGQHADLAPDQCGATAHRLGKQLVATLLATRYELGIPERKLPRLAEMTLGLRVTQSAVNQMATRIAAPGKALQQHLSGLTEQLRSAQYVHHDDTGWRIGGQTAWVSGFRSSHVALFTINNQHTRLELLDTLKDFNGVLVVDRFKVYDSHDLSHLQQQKCLAHLLRNIDEVLVEQQGKRGQGKRYPERLKALLQESLQMHKAFLVDNITQAQLGEKAAELNQKLDDLLLRPPLKNRANERLRKGLLKQHLKGRILHFLNNPDIPPTNNAAERQLRNVVTTRKVSQCSKTALGAMNYASIKSVVETARLRGEDPVALLARLYR